MLNVLETLRLIDNSKCIELDINMQLVILIKKKKDFYCVNVIGDKLILNFGAKFVPHDNLYFTYEITKLPWQPSVRFRVKMATKFQNVMNEDARVWKDALENLNTRKSTSRRILTGVLSKHSELKPNF